MENLFEKAANLDDLTAVQRHHLNFLFQNFTDFVYNSVYPSYSNVEMSRNLELYSTAFAFKLSFPANHCPENRDLFIELGKIWNKRFQALQTIQVQEAQVNPLYENIMVFQIEVLFRPIDEIGQLTIF